MAATTRITGPIDIAAGAPTGWQRNSLSLPLEDLSWFNRVIHRLLRVAGVKLLYDGLRGL